MGPSGIYQLKQLVRKGRFELPRVTPLAPKTSASTSSATFARPGGDNDVQAQRGGPCRARTCDPLIKSQLLYQLS